jgi:hypothetical protein
MTQKNKPQIPVKWLVVLVFALVAYGLGQPLANRKFGWQLPSVASILGQKEPAAADKNQPAQANEKSKQVAEQSSKSIADKSSAAPASKQKAEDENLLYGFLKEIGDEDYQSPSGLRFTRGSEEGHRLKHLARHLEDIPNREGRHGVFNGDMEQVLRLLDEAYDRGTSGAKGTTKSEEKGRTTYEVSFSKTIGYIGGTTGARQKNPESKRVRMIVEKDRLITAFPF